MRRLCGRPGCSGPATATFTFDATRCVVWLNPLSDGTARAGDLCTRHADALAPPQGWDRVDRRVPRPVELAVAPALPSPLTADVGRAEPGRAEPGERDDLLPARRRRRKRWSEVPSLFDAVDDAEREEVDSTHPDPAIPEPSAADDEPAWLPRFAPDDDLDGLLDAETPLLARAFRNVRGASDADDD